MNKLSTIFFALFFLTCGANRDFSDYESAENDDGTLSINLKGLDGHEDLDYLTIKISASDIINPINADFKINDLKLPIKIYNIPVGENRIISVSSFNSNNELIYSGSAQNISIIKNQTTKIDIVLNKIYEPNGNIELNITFNDEDMSAITIFAFPVPALIGEEVKLKATIENIEYTGLLWEATCGEFYTNSETEVIWQASNQKEICDITLNINYTEKTVSYTFSIEVLDQIVNSGDIAINEFLADPPDNLAGDANNDGIRDTEDDEFIELVNTTDHSINLLGFSISDSTNVRFEFDTEYILEAGKAVCIFGGGAPALDYVDTFIASSGLNLNNSSDAITLFDADNNTIDSVIYGDEAGNNQSITRYPDKTGNFVGHGSVSGILFSPGLKVDGTNF
jgi:hypothetical protein